MAVSISQATPQERLAACRVLVSVRPPMDRDRAAQRHADLFDSRELDPAGLFVARGASGVLHGAMIVQEMPGALGLAWAPVVSRGRDRTAIEDALVAKSCGWLQARGVKVCQAFGSEPDAFAPLARHGFQCVTRLTDLNWKLESTDPPDPRFGFEPLGETNQAEFARTLLATLEGSLDCPEVTGSRTDAELLAGYLQGPGSHAHWFHVTMQSEPLGVVMLEPTNEAVEWELTYVGIAANFRGRRLGVELVKFALHHAANRGAHTVVLSVDSRNAPALKLYQTLGFKASGERDVFLAHWPPIS